MFLYDTLKTRDFCPYSFSDSLFKRDIQSTANDIESTAQSFRSWNTCMDNTTCKIVAIIGICLLSIFLIWFVIGILRCLCQGIGLCASFCCCCCCTAASAAKHHGYTKPQNYQPMYHQGGYYPNTMSRNVNDRSVTPEYGWVGNNDDYKPGRDFEMNYHPYHNDSRTAF